MHSVSDSPIWSFRLVSASLDIDNDPIVLAHARAVLTSNETGATEYIDADLRDTGAIIAQASQLLDISQPVALTLIAILHAIPDSDDPHAIVATLMDAVPSGSYLAVSHMGSDLIPSRRNRKWATSGAG